MEKKSRALWQACQNSPRLHLMSITSSLGWEAGVQAGVEGPYCCTAQGRRGLTGHMGCRGWPLAFTHPFYTHRRFTTEKKMFFPSRRELGTHHPTLWSIALWLGSSLAHPRRLGKPVLGQPGTPTRPCNSPGGVPVAQGGRQRVNSLKNVRFILKVKLL